MSQQDNNDEEWMTLEEVQDMIASQSSGYISSTNAPSHSYSSTQFGVNINIGTSHYVSPFMSQDLPPAPEPVSPSAQFVEVTPVNSNTTNSSSNYEPSVSSVNETLRDTYLTKNFVFPPHKYRWEKVMSELNQFNGFKTRQNKKPDLCQYQLESIPDDLLLTSDKIKQNYTQMLWDMIYTILTGRLIDRENSVVTDLETETTHHLEEGDNFQSWMESRVQFLISNGEQLAKDIETGNMASETELIQQFSHTLPLEERFSYTKRRIIYQLIRETCCQQRKLRLKSNYHQHRKDFEANLKTVTDDVYRRPAPPRKLRRSASDNDISFYEERR